MKMPVDRGRALGVGLGGWTDWGLTNVDWRFVTMGLREIGRFVLIRIH